MKITADDRRLADSTEDLLVLPVGEIEPGRWRIPVRYRPIDRALGGGLAAAVATGDFRGRRGQSLALYPAEALRTRRILLVGLGPERELDPAALRMAAGVAVSAARERRAARVAFAVPPHRGLRPELVGQALAEGAALGAYRFDTYKTAQEEPPGEVRSLALRADRSAELRALRAGVRVGTVLGECQNEARRLSNLPGNALPPAALAREAQKVAREVGLRCRVLGVPELRRRRMGALLAVGQGSSNPPRLAVLEHRGTRGRTAGRTVCIVGKGITFDSGGISLKPGQGMDEMKHDMSGAAAVIGALRAAALLDLPLHVVGVVAAAENLPSGTAYRPGDILTTASGKTVEVLNTDAEGRLALCDALHFARTEYEPEAIVDFATLTGACVVALGPWCSGAFGNDERLLEEIRGAGEACGERIWPMPLWKEHLEHIKSPVADLKNVGGREGGAITAAAFLGAFAGETPWVHVDIAGTAWTSKTSPTQPHGATGVGVRLTLEWLRRSRVGKAD